MKRTVLIYALVLLVVFTAIVAVAQGRKGNQPAGSSIPRWVNPPTNQQPGCLANCQQALGLSQKQIADMAEIRTKFTNDTANLRAALEADMKEIAGLWNVTDPDLKLIKQKFADADQVRAEIRDKAIDARGAMLKVLTPEQRAACIKLCQSGQCGCGMCNGLGMGIGMGMCGTGGGNAAGTCPMGPGKGKGCGAGMGTGRGQCGGCPMKQ